jgi:hypothetical protein
MGCSESKHGNQYDEESLLIEYALFVTKYCDLCNKKHVSMNEFVAAFATYLRKNNKYKDVLAYKIVSEFIYGDVYSGNTAEKSRNMIKRIDNVDVSCGDQMIIFDISNNIKIIDTRYIIGLYLKEFP